MSSRLRWRVKRSRPQVWSAWRQDCPGADYGDCTCRAFPTWDQALDHALTNGHHEEPPC